MSFDIGWAYAPDEVQGANGFTAARGGVLYEFMGADLGVPRISLGNYVQRHEITDWARSVPITDCHLHVRGDQPNIAHVTWTIMAEDGYPAKLWQWYDCVPQGSVSHSGFRPAEDFKEAYPGNWRTGVWAEGSEVWGIIDDHTEPYSTMLVTELAAALLPAGGGTTTRPRQYNGFSLGWGYAPQQIGGASGDYRGSDVVYVMDPPVATAGGYPVASCELWLSPQVQHAVQVNYQLTADPDPIDVTHWYVLDMNGGCSRSTSSVSADGSAAPEGAAAASDELWTASDGLAAAAAGGVTPD